MKEENTPSKSSIKSGATIELETRFGGLSLGKCWGKFYPGKTRATGDFDWVEKSGGTLYLSGPGYYIVGSSDGFSRAARAEFTLSEKKVVTPEERAAKLREQIASALAKGEPETLLTTTLPVGTLLPGNHTRAALMAERQRLLAEIEATA